MIVETDLAIFDSRRFPVFRKGGIVQNLLEFFTVLHLAVPGRVSEVVEMLSLSAGS